MQRQIIIGLITSNEYTQRIRKKLDLGIFDTKAARQIASWCLQYYDEYKKVPFRNISNILQTAIIQDTIDPDLADEIEEDILPGLSRDYEDTVGFNVEYWSKNTIAYINEWKITQLNEQVDLLKEKGRIKEAEELITAFKSTSDEDINTLDLSSADAIERVREAFNQKLQQVVMYPGAIGEFLNDDLIRGAFVGFLAPEKRGKTWFLMDMAMRGAYQGKKVLFIQAGDMTESQQLRRMCIYLAKKSDKQKYTGKQYIPIKDCIHNQLDTCTKEVRECDFGVWDGTNIDTEILRKVVTYEELIEAYQEYPEYRACHNCIEYQNNTWGCPWLDTIDVGDALEEREAVEVYEKFFLKHKKSFKMSTYANGELTTKTIDDLLTTYEQESNFVPDLIIVDYADLITPVTKEFRHGQNEIWKYLRSLSQSKNALVVTATQADSNSYEKDNLNLKNYSEDKRKYAHVTAMYALNQSTDGREKRIGILRIGELLKREGDYDSQKNIFLLQKLAIGKPLLSSYY